MRVHPVSDESPVKRGGRPKSSVTKLPVTIRLSPDVVEPFRASGKGWQTRMNEALREWLKTNPMGTSS
ncbi:MAG: BrnA antitoxin family protein [Pseudomonadales bacterium]